MGSMNPFSKPKAPKAPEPVPVPTKAQSAKELNAASEEEKQARKLQKGRSGTRLSGRLILGDDAAGSGGTGVGTKTILGG